MFVPSALHEAGNPNLYIVTNAIVRHNSLHSHCSWEARELEVYSDQGVHQTRCTCSPVHRSVAVAALGTLGSLCCSSNTTFEVKMP